MQHRIEGFFKKPGGDSNSLLEKQLHKILSKDMCTLIAGGCGAIQQFILRYVCVCDFVLFLMEMNSQQGLCHRLK